MFHKRSLKCILWLWIQFSVLSFVHAQELTSIEISTRYRVQIASFNAASESFSDIPLFSLKIDDNWFCSLMADMRRDKAIINDQVECSWSFPPYPYGIKGMLTFTNTTSDTLRIHNVVPMGESPVNVYITGKGDHYLSRSYLFRPDAEPVNVILPDNAWELGFNAVALNDTLQVAALARRDRESLDKGQLKRFETILYPGGSISYTMWINRYQGNWQEGLRKIFQEHMLYDVEPGSFDNSLYEREDLEWVRHACVSHLIMAWDNYFYDYESHSFNLKDFMERGEQLYGGDDFIGLWPTWPTLGLDQRNQWDLYRDLPGGLDSLRALSGTLERYGSKLFISYNPWDESTRREEHLEGMAELIAGTGAMGVVLDTRGESSKELQKAADGVRKGVVMYSEGMAIPMHMQGIISGRVHNALYYCPMLNLNKFIKPEFSIFRVAELAKEPVQREFCTSFFNGYGVELNIFAPGKPAWIEEQYRYLGRTSRILRENTDNFVSSDWIPLIPVKEKNIWVNKWPAGEKVLYTIYSTISGGYKDMLFGVEPKEGYHFVDLWHHKLLEPEEKNDQWYIEAETDAFHSKWLGTNNEGEVDCIARLPKQLYSSLEGDVLSVRVESGDEIRIWAGNPDYEKEALILDPGEHTLRLLEMFGRYEGKFVIQAFGKGILLDEDIVEIKAGTPRLASTVIKTTVTKKVPEGMVKIPGGEFTFHTSNGDEFIAYPDYNSGKTYAMKSFYMDKYPVTNEQFLEFIKESNYQPGDTSNFLKHWKNGNIPEGMEKYPVVYVSWEDARAYADWAGKRLPTEVEWQYAAQTPAENDWPWVQENEVTYREEEVTNTLTVYKIEGIDPSVCNMESGELYPVGSYPEGANPYGLEDLVGSVWQLTNDLYVSGSYRYIMMKGGSYFNPSSSWWYVQGGPRPLHYRQYLLRVSEGFERNATVGFRCVVDGEE